MILNITIYKCSRKLTTMDIKDVYLDTDISDYYYMCVPISMIPEKIKYNTNYKIYSMPRTTRNQYVFGRPFLLELLSRIRTTNILILIIRIMYYLSINFKQK